MRQVIYIVFFLKCIVISLAMVSIIERNERAYGNQSNAKKISIGGAYGLLVVSDPSEGSPIIDGTGFDGNLKLGKCFFRDQWICSSLDFGYFYESWVRSRDNNGGRLTAGVVLDGPTLGVSTDVLPLSKFVSKMPVSIQPLLTLDINGGFGRLLSGVAASSADAVETSQTFHHYSYGTAIGVQLTMDNGLFLKGFSGICRRSRKLKSLQISSDRLFYGGAMGFSF